jgi:hypothetical protein
MHYVYLESKVSCVHESCVVSVTPKGVFACSYMLCITRMSKHVAYKGTQTDTVPLQ